MVFAGLAVTLLGFLLSVLGLGIASGTGARLAFVLVGIALSLFGMLGLINRVYVSNAIWRKHEK